MEWTEICSNTIEGIHIQLRSNHNKKSYQEIMMTNTITMHVQKRCIIAPVDFYTVASAIMCNNVLKDFCEDVQDTWSEHALTDMIQEITHQKEMGD